MTKENKDKNADKVSRIITFIANMGYNEETKPTPMASSLGLHPDTLRKKLDECESFQEAGKIRIIRDNSGEIIRIIKERDEDKNKLFKKEIREQINEIKEIVESIKPDLNDVLAKLNLKKNEKEIINNSAN